MSSMPSQVLVATKITSTHTVKVKLLAVIRCDTLSTGAVVPPISRDRLEATVTNLTMSTAASRRSRNIRCWLRCSLRHYKAVDTAVHRITSLTSEPP